MNCTQLSALLDKNCTQLSALSVIFLIRFSYVVKGDIEMGYGNIIPLWMFGMLY